jgi:arginase
MGDKKVVFRGMCYDAGSSFMRGPAKAPEKIRQALHSGSMNYFSEDVTDLSQLADWDLGDFTPNTYYSIAELTRVHLEGGAKILTLGGDHAISYPIIKAYQEVYPKLDILHIDAHADLYQEYEGDPFSHACPFARIMEEGLVNRLVQVGIRTLNRHQSEQANRFGVEIYPMNIRPDELRFQFENPVYISVDIDALDPAFAPGVSHREPGGLSTRQLLSLLQNLEANVVGADLVEYNPDQDLGDTTAYVGAKLTKELLALLLRN